MLPHPVVANATESRNILLPCRGMVSLNDVRGATLRITQGPVWITQSGICEDVFLDAGESFCVTRSGLTVITACHDAPFTVVTLERPVVVGPTLRERLRRTFRGLAAAAACWSAYSSYAVPLPEQTVLFRSASTGTTVSGDVSTLRPAGIVQGDLLLAAVATSSPGTTILPPLNGWALLDLEMSGQSSGGSLAIYYKFATGAEPSSYFWDLGTHAGAVISLMAFSGVDAADPIDQFAGQSTGFSLSHTAPSIEGSVDNEMIVSFFMFGSSSSWTMPAGMTEDVDRNSAASTISAGVTLGTAHAWQAFAGATGMKTAVAGNFADYGNAISISLHPVGDYSSESIPEPSSLPLVALALAGLGAVRHRSTSSTTSHPRTFGAMRPIT